MNYGLTIENQNAAIKAAKEKSDGIYHLRGCGLSYVVRDGKVRFFAAFGEIFQSFGNFNVLVGAYEHTISSQVNKQNIKKAIKDA